MADWYRLGNGVPLPPGMPSPQGSLHTCSWDQLSSVEQGFSFSEESEVERDADYVHEFDTKVDNVRKFTTESHRSSSNQILVLSTIQNYFT